MTSVPALIALALAGLIAGGVILVRARKKSPVPSAPFLRMRPQESSPEDRAALTELAAKTVGRYPELGSTPAELLAEIDASLKKGRSSPDNTPRVILEDMLRAASLRQAASYWQVHEFLHYREKLRKARRA